MAVREYTDLVNAPKGQDGIDALQVNPRSGLHRNVWIPSTTAIVLDTAGGPWYGPVFPNNRVKIEQVYLTVVQAINTSQEAILQLGVVGDADEFGTLDFQTDAPWADGQAANDITDASGFLLENEQFLEAGEQMLLTLTEDATHDGSVVVTVEYSILDDV